MNKYNRVNLYKERSESFIQRTVSLLEQTNFASDYNKEVEAFHERLLEGGCNAYSAAEDALDFSASLADEYMLLSDGIYSAALTAFFHLWERDVRDLCCHLLRHYPVTRGNEQVTKEKVQNYKYDGLMSLLIFWGAKEPIFHEINILRLVVNTVKHSTGPSASELLAIDSPYYNKLVLLCNLEGRSSGDDELRMLSLDDLKHFGKAVSSFWEELGKTISI